MSVCVCILHVCRCLWRTEQELDPLELELTGSCELPDMGVGTGLWFFARAASALSLSPASVNSFLNTEFPFGLVH